MMGLKSDEKILAGQWLVEGDKVIADDVCRRIDWLIESQMERLTTKDWETLYQDKCDNRFWELTYPHSEMHGGGPPQLSVISPEIASEKYGI